MALGRGAQWKFVQGPAFKTRGPKLRLRKLYLPKGTRKPFAAIEAIA